LIDHPSVVIIGGGPAGLAAAIVLASNQIPTVLFEKGKLPHDKPCGEGIMPTGVDFLRRFGVDSGIDRNQIFRFDGITYRAFGRSTAAGTFREGCGWGMPRTVLSRALFQRATQLENLEIFQNSQPELLVEEMPVFGSRQTRGRFSPDCLLEQTGSHRRCEKSRDFGNLTGMPTAGE